MTRRTATVDTVEVSARTSIVDDHEAFRAAAKATLEQAGFVIVGESSTGREAVALARILRPDVVLLDVSLPDASGLTVCRQLVAADPAVMVVLCSINQLHDEIRGVAQSGARGFVLKEAFSAEAVCSIVDRRR